MGKNNKKRKKLRKRKESMRKKSLEKLNSPRKPHSLGIFLNCVENEPERSQDTLPYVLSPKQIHRSMTKAVEVECQRHEELGLMVRPPDFAPYREHFQKPIPGYPLSRDCWPFSRMWAGLGDGIELQGHQAAALLLDIDAQIPYTGQIVVIFGFWFNDPRGPEGTISGVITVTSKTTVDLFHAVLANVEGPGDVGSFLCYWPAFVLKELQSLNPLNLEVAGGRAHTPSPASEPKPLPEPYYPVQSGPSYASSQETRLSGEPTNPLRFRHDRRGSESVRVRRGELPLSDKRRRHLEALECRIYDDRNKKLSAEDAKRLKRRGKRGRRPDEWLAIKSWRVRETVVGDPELPYIPGIRGK